MAEFVIQKKRYTVEVDPADPTRLVYTTAYTLSNGLVERLEESRVSALATDPQPTAANLDAKDAAVLAAANA